MKTDLSQKDIDELLDKMEKISPKVVELVKPIRDMPHKYQEVALTKLYTKTREWKASGGVRK